MKLSSYRSPEGGWIRFGRYCLLWTCGRLLFSERNGYVKRWRIPFTRWRVGFDRD